MGVRAKDGLENPGLFIGAPAHRLIGAPISPICVLILSNMLRGFFALIAAIVGVWAALATSGSGYSNPFRQLLGQSQEQAADVSVWFERADGRGRFILDRTNRPALLWADGSVEVLALYRARASGGGEVWLTDTDQTVLRQSNLGGWTFFPPDRRDGVIVEEVGRARTLIAAPANAADIEDAANEMVARLARVSRNQVRAELTALSPDQNPYIIDAMVMVTLAADAASRRSVRDLEIVRIGVGEAPRARFDGRVLDISVATHMGYGGRPSSDYLRRTFERGAS